MASGTRAPSTIVTINLSGQTEFNIPFEYLARKYVIVTLLGIDRKVLTLNTDYRFVGKTIISLANPTPAGYSQLELRRETSATERLVDFHDGSILRAYDLNLSQIQTLHVAEEARDLTADTIGVNDEGHLDARNRKIVNLAYAEHGGDAIPLGQVMQWNESALNSANLAVEKADQAHVSAVNALAYAERSEAASRNADAQAAHATDRAAHAEAMANSASASKNAAEAARDVAVQSKDIAVAEAAKAKTEADRAKTEADKLGDWNELAGITTVTPTHLRFERNVTAVGNEGFTAIVNGNYGGYRIEHPLIQYALVNLDASIEEHVRGSGGGSFIMTRKVYADGTTVYSQRNTYHGSTQFVGAVESDLQGTQFRHSISYNPTTDTRMEYDYVFSHQVINANGQLVGGRHGSVTSVGNGIDIGLDPNRDFDIRLHQRHGTEPLGIKKDTFLGQHTEMVLPAQIASRMDGSLGGMDRVWVRHFDDGYFEQGGEIFIDNRADGHVLNFPYAFTDLWDISITPITEGDHRAGAAEANNVIIALSPTSFRVSSGMAKTPCRFKWRANGTRVN